jgi:hypothetical protein
MYVVMDKHDNPWGPFENLEAAHAWACGKWGDKMDDRLPPHKEGWSIVAIRPAD